jgi:hypothetical protein
VDWYEAIAGQMELDAASASSMARCAAGHLKQRDPHFATTYETLQKEND